MTTTETTQTTTVMDAIAADLAGVDYLEATPDPHTLKEQLVALLNSSNSTNVSRAVEYLIAARKQWQLEQAQHDAAAKAEIAKGKVFGSLVDEMEGALKVYMQNNDIETVDTPSGSVTLHVAGGKDPVVIDTEFEKNPEKAPEAWRTVKTTVSLNKGKIYEALKLGTFKYTWARLGQKAKSLRFS